MKKRTDWLLNTKKGVVTTFALVFVLIILLGFFRVYTAPDPNPSYTLTVEAGNHTPTGTPFVTVDN